MIRQLEEKYNKLINENKKQEARQVLASAKKDLGPYDRLNLARHPSRPKPQEIIDYLIDDPISLRGDRAYGDDKAILCGLGFYKNEPIAFVATRKGTNTEENIAYNFGMPRPEGYRKVQRIMKYANKFNLPLVSFIDTAGAYPGLDAEERGQAQAIAECLRLSFDLGVPFISVITGEGGSGGALALGLGNSLIMLENSTYSILSPEGFSSILWKSATRAEEASEIMKFTAEDLKDLGLVDVLVEEDIAFDKEDFGPSIHRLDVAIERELRTYKKFSKEKIKNHRQDKFRRF